MDVHETERVRIAKIMRTWRRTGPFPLQSKAWCAVVVWEDKGKTDGEAKETSDPSLFFRVLLVSGSRKGQLCGAKSKPKGSSKCVRYFNKEPVLVSHPPQRKNTEQEDAEQRRGRCSPAATSPNSTLMQTTPIPAWPSWRQCACFGAGLHPCPSLGAALGAAETIVVPVFTVKTPGDDSVAVNEAVEHNALWDEMTAREGREAARRAGMKTGDWQAERQLQEALRESRREVGNAGLAAGGDEETGEEKSFVDVGFHAFATEAVEGGGDNMSEHERGMSIGENVGGSEAREEGERRVGRQDEQAAEKEEELEQEMEDEAEGFGGVELMVTDNADVEAIPTVRGDGRHSPTKGVSGSRRGAARCRLEEGGWEESKMELVDDREARKVSKVARGKGGSSRPGGDGGRRKCVSSKEGTREGRRLKGVSAGELGGAAARDVGAGVDKKQDERQRVEQGEVKDGDGDGERLDDDEDGDAVAEPLPPDIMLTLNDDSLHRIMLFLHPEDAIECRVVSSRWEFPSHEAVFEGLCRRTYLAQSAKKLLNVKRWRTWQRMFRLRPRLRDTGLYSLKTTYYKKPVRDMSTSWTPGQILEVTYYRYFRFFGDGRVAYGLTHESPKEFVRLLQEDSPKVYYGTYTINKAEVKVEMPTSWSHVYFTLQLTSGERGRFTHLVMERHSSIPRNDPRAGLCNHPVKSSDVFTFRRVLQF